MLRVDTK